MNNHWLKAQKILDKNGGVVVLPTDTLYGIIGKAKSKQTVEKIYKIKGRDKTKPFIVLINSYRHLVIFNVKITKEQAKILEKFWPGKVSVILPCELRKWQYLHRGTKSIAFRMIGSKNKNLFDLINKIGPLVAPSVNKQGDKPAEDIGKAKKYFGDKIDLYVSGGKKKSNPSTLIEFKNNRIVVLRQGKTRIK